MEEILKIHSRFLRDTIELNKFNDNLLTLLPSFIFLSCNFFLIYTYCHRFTRMGITSLKSWIYRELAFHWSFFYLSKLWLIFMKSFKYLFLYLCNERTTSMHPNQCQYLGISIISLISVIPLIICMVKLCSRHRIPNFLMWVGEDPWLRNEIGLAGHYLDRPPQFSLPSPRNNAYKTRRSSSQEETSKRGSFLRVSRSLQILKCDKSDQYIY